MYLMQEKKKEQEYLRNKFPNDKNVMKMIQKHVMLKECYNQQEV